MANNPTIFAIREAQLLWPDTKIDTLVSIGSGSVPTKVTNPCFESVIIFCIWKRRSRTLVVIPVSHLLLHFL